MPGMLYANASEFPRCIRVQGGRAEQSTAEAEQNGGESGEESIA